MDRELIKNSDIQNVISENACEALVEHSIKKTDRSACVMLAEDIARAHGNKGFKGVIKATFRGSAGQSFGAFVLPGLNVRLIGEGNDYAGKGMHGGEIVVIPDEKSSFVASESCIVGNACLHGSTGEELHANSRAGECFCVRNSGAKAAVEGTSDHVCEYDRWRRSELGRRGVKLLAGMCCLKYLKFIVRNYVPCHVDLSSF